MRILAKFIVSVVELLESEARSLKANIMVLVSYLVFLAAATLVLLGGTALLLYGFYALLATAINHIAAVMIVGGVTVVFGYLLIYVIRRAEIN